MNTEAERLAELRRLLEQAREALVFYSEHRNYRLAAGDRCEVHHGAGFCGMEHQDVYDGDLGPGARARAAITAIDEGIGGSK